MDLLRGVALVEVGTEALGELREWLNAADYPAREFDSVGELLEEGTDDFGLVCLGENGSASLALRTLQLLKQRDADLPILIIASEPAVEAAVGAIRAGAEDYLATTVERDQFIQAVRDAGRRRSRSFHERLGTDMCVDRQFSQIIGKTRPIRALLSHLARVASSDIAVALFGETGTGKEVVARSIHDGGLRCRGPFVALNCAAIPATLQEAELFGHERGAFTGAVTGRKGAFEQAHGGTLLLDEVGEMSPGAQVALLRVLQEKAVRRVGGSREIPVDVRVICATSRDLEADVQAGSFRKDLYYRLVVYSITLPPLRKRRADIPLLVKHILLKQQATTGGRANRFDDEALASLMAYDWPGNIRELQNVVTRAMVICDGAEVQQDHLPFHFRRRQPHRPAPGGDVTVSDGVAEQRPGARQITPLRELERIEILRALSLTKGNVARAARMLEIGRATLYRRIAAEHIELDGERAATAPMGSPRMAR